MPTSRELAAPPPCHPRKHVPHPKMLAVKPENILLFSPDNLTQGPCDAKSYNMHQANLLQLAAQAAPQSSGASSLHKAGFMAKLTDWGSAFFSTVTDMREGKARGRSARGSTLYSCPEVQLIHVLSTSPEKSPAGVPRTDLWPTEATTAQAVAQAQEGYSPYAADVWSFGITVYAMVLGRAPFSVASPASKAFRAFVRATQPHVMEDIAMAPCYNAWNTDVGADGHLPQWHWPSSFSPALVDLLTKCLQVREADRATVGEIKAPPWFTSPKWTPATMPPGMKLPASVPLTHNPSSRSRDNSDGRTHFSASTGALSRGRSEHGTPACGTPGHANELHSRSDVAAWDQATADCAAAQGGGSSHGGTPAGGGEAASSGPCVTDNSAAIMHARQASVPHSDSDTDEDGDTILADGAKQHTITETTGTPPATQQQADTEPEVQHRSKLPRKLPALDCKSPQNVGSAGVHASVSASKVVPQQALASPATAAADTEGFENRRRVGSSKCFGTA